MAMLYLQRGMNQKPMNYIATLTARTIEICIMFSLVSAVNALLTALHERKPITTQHTPHTTHHTPHTTHHTPHTTYHPLRTTYHRKRSITQTLVRVTLEIIISML